MQILFLFFDVYLAQDKCLMLHEFILYITLNYIKRKIKRESLLVNLHFLISSQEHIRIMVHFHLRFSFKSGKSLGLKFLKPLHLILSLLELLSFGKRGEPFVTLERVKCQFEKFLHSGDGSVGKTLCKLSISHVNDGTIQCCTLQSINKLHFHQKCRKGDGVT